MVHVNRVAPAATLKLVIANLLLSLTMTGVAWAQNPVPLINQPLVPDTAVPRGKGFTLRVNGTGFVSGSTVNWNGSALATKFVSGSELTATVPASDIAAESTASVTVVNPGPGGGLSNPAFFPISFPVNLFFAGSSFAAGSALASVVQGDFNGDGKLDLAVTNYNSSGSVSILLGNGDGTFQAAKNYAVGDSPGYLAVGDFNGDGKPDLAVPNTISNNVSILLGNGDGTFQAEVPYLAGTNPNGLAVGDFNADGKLDLVVANPGSNNVSVLLGNGDGTFQSPVNYASGGSALGEIAVGDFDGDGKLDLAVANQYSGGPVSVFLGNGDGTFQPAVNYTVGSSPHGVAAGDFNGDGKLDLAVANNISNDVSILLGNGDGTFQPAVNYGAGAGPNSVEVADFNEDGKLDLVVADAFSNTVSVLFGNGDGTFQPAIPYTSVTQANAAVPGDFNGDGRLDLAIADLTTGTVDILLQDGAVTLTPSSLSFGVQVLQTGSAAQNVILTNVGNKTLNISSIAITGIGAGDYAENNTCASSLAVGAHCAINVTFKPTALGPRTAAVTVSDDAAGSPQSVSLSGIGVASGPNATLSAAKLTFATQRVGTTSAAQLVTLINYGTTVLSFTSIVAGGDFSATNTCGSSLAVLASCTASVTFTPTKIGSRTGMLSFSDDAPGSPQNVSLRGTGTVVDLNPASLSYGIHRVGTSSTLATTLTNVGGTTLSFTGIAITGTNPGDFSQTNTCGTSIGAGASCSISVTFTPKAAGRRTADVSISDNGGASPQNVALSGTGCVPLRKHFCLAAASMNLATVRSALTRSQTVAVPSITGSSKFGTLVMDMADSRRDDPFLANGTKRELLVRFWYPTSLAEDCQPAEYTSPKVWSSFAQLTRLSLPQVMTNSCLNAPVTNGVHPVVVFTHGYTGTFTDYTFLFEELASRGYVVASIDHTYEATAVEFPDGRLVEGILGSHFGDTWRVDDQTLDFAVSVRVKDLAFVVDQLERVNGTAGAPFSGKLDMSRIALMGHSLGGETTIAGLQQEPRFRAGVTLDGVLNDASVAGTDKALLILAAGREQWSERECKLWTSLKGPRLAVNIRGAEHLTPSDAVWLAEGAIKTGNMGTEKSIAAVRNYIAAFLDSNIRNEPSSPLLSGRSATYSDIAVTTQKQSLCGEGMDR